MKIQFRWFHNNYMDQQPKLQYRKTNDFTNTFNKWITVPHVFADQLKEPKSPKVRKKNVA